MKLTLIIVSIFGLISVGSSVEWWEDATFYQIYPRSYADSDGNGVGDLNGIASKLEYLKEIGVTATWLSPIFKSPMADFGYDVSNFFEVDPIFGTMEDFDNLIRRANEVGIKIVLDFVPNHSSDECEWFQKSIDNDPLYKDFYIWHPGKMVNGVRQPPSNWVSVFGGKAWTWNEKRQEYYLHQFLAKQPDFNFRNPQMREKFLEILKFWLDKGVYGFRIDAVPHIFEKLEEDGNWPDEPRGWNDDPDNYDYLDHIYTKDQEETFAVIYEWRAFMDKYKLENGGDTRVLLAEAYSSVETLDKYHGNEQTPGAQIPFNFALMGVNGYTNALELQESIDYWMNIMWNKHKTANWVLGNHDNPRIAARCGAHKVDLINIILGTLPGITVTYYGEEIGMTDVPTECTEISCDDRDPERTPMQWNSEISAGFSTNPITWLPVGSNYKRFNVKNERKSAKSHFNIYKEIQLLKRTKAFESFKVDGAFSYGALNKQVFHVRRSVDDEYYLVVVNMGNNVESFKFPSGFFSADIKDLKYYLTTAHSTHYNGDIFKTENTLVLMPFEAVILKWTK